MKGRVTNTESRGGKEKQGASKQCGVDGGEAHEQKLNGEDTRVCAKTWRRGREKHTGNR